MAEVNGGKWHHRMQGKVGGEGRQTGSERGGQRSTMEAGVEENGAGWFGGSELDPGHRERR